jgi:ribosomal protein S17
MSGKRFQGHVHKILDPRTVAVKVKMTKYHSLYKVSYTQKRKFWVDKTPNTTVTVGEAVSIISCARVSKTKSYRLETKAIA